MEWIGEAASLGVGCVLAILIFLMYRIDRKSDEKRAAASERRYIALIEADQETRKDNTAALKELIVVCQYLRNGHGGG